MKGTLLVTVLWILVVLGIFTAAVGRLAAQELVFAGWLRDRALGNMLSASGVERALAEIQADRNPAYDGLSDGWAQNEAAFREIPAGEGSFSVVCGGRFGACDESARVNLNTASLPVLIGLVRALDPAMDDARVVAIAQSIWDWRDADDAALPGGAESPYYRSLAEPYEARNRAFETVEELGMVRGMDETMYRKLAPFVTVYTDGKVNLNTAPLPVLIALGLRTDLAEKLAAYRLGPDGIAGTADDQVFQSPEAVTAALTASLRLPSSDVAELSNFIAAAGVSVKADAFRIVSKGKRGGREETVTAVAKRDGRILYWKEGAS